MASFGAKYPNFAPFEGNEPEAALPTYGPKVTIGKLVSANLTVNLSSGELYADDALDEQLSEFVSGSLALETNDMLDEVAAVLYGASVTEGEGAVAGEVKYNAGDTVPNGGLTYFKVLMRNGKKVYKGYFYPKVKAALGNDNAQTKGSSVTFGTSSTTLTVFAPNVGDWRITKEFNDEAEVRAWCDEKLAGA